MPSRLTGDQVRFIVRRLAAFDPPQRIIASFVAHFRARIELDDVLACDPSRVLLAPDLCQLFHAERARILSDPAAAPLAERNARLIMLSGMAQDALANNQAAQAAQFLEQIKRETESVGPAAEGSKTDAPSTITWQIVDPPK